MAVIEKTKDQLMSNDFSDRVMEISKVKVGGLTDLFAGITSEEKMKKAIWSEILAVSRKWVIKAEAIEIIWKNFDPDKLILKVPTNIAELSKSVYLQK